MEKKEFTATVLDSKYETFIVYIAFISSTPLIISLSSTPLDADDYSFSKPQISGLIAKKAFTKVLNKYINFTDVFSLDLTSELLKYTGINNYTTELVDS